MNYLTLELVFIDILISLPENVLTEVFISISYFVLKSQRCKI